jgi:hypothetical protein
MSRIAAIALVGTLGALGCAATGPAELGAGVPDQPVPASEPRAELRLTVDLPATRECEESLDLELYRNRGVELVAWDERHGWCEGRRIVVRYLSRQLTAGQALELVRAHCRRVTVAQEQADSHATPPKSKQ